MKNFGFGLIYRKERERDEAEEEPKRVFFFDSVFGKKKPDS
jgi:hypothetical protein